MKKESFLNISVQCALNTKHKKQVLNFDPESYNNKTTQDWETLVFQRNTWRDVERTNPTSAPQDANFGYVTLVTES